MKIKKYSKLFTFGEVYHIIHMNIYSCVNVRWKHKMKNTTETHIHEKAIQRVQKEMLSQDQYNELSTLFKIFSDPTRLKILSLLFKEELCVYDLTVLLDMTQSAVSHQLSILRQNRLIKYRRMGKNVCYSLDDEHIQLIYNAGLSHILEE